MLDQGNLRLTNVSETGVAERRFAYPFGADPRGVCELRKSQVRLRGLLDHEIERISGDTTLIGRSPLPWPELGGLPVLARQAMIFPNATNDVCLLSLTFGPRFALLDANGTRALGTWIEAVPLAKVRALGKGSWTMLPGNVISTTSATAVGDAFAVLFEGQTARKRRVIDLYDAGDARYLVSVELPFEATVLSFGHGFLLTLGETPDGVPFVRALRVTPSLETIVARAQPKSP